MRIISHVKRLVHRGPIALAKAYVSQGLRCQGPNPPQKRQNLPGPDGCRRSPCPAGLCEAGLVRSRRLELPRAFAHNDLNVARLPIPPRPLNQRGAKSLGFLAPRGGRSAPLAKGAGGRKRETGVNLCHRLVPAGDGAFGGVAWMVNRAFTFGNDAADCLDPCCCRAPKRRN